MCRDGIGSLQRREMADTFKQRDFGVQQSFSHFVLHRRRAGAVFRSGENEYRHTKCAKPPTLVTS